MKAADVITGKPYAEFMDRDHAHPSNVIIFLDSPRRLYGSGRRFRNTGPLYEPSEAPRPRRDRLYGNVGYAAVRVRATRPEIIQRARGVLLDEFLATTGGVPDLSGVEIESTFLRPAEFTLITSLIMLSGETWDEAQDRERRTRAAANEAYEARRASEAIIGSTARLLVAALAARGIRAGVVSNHHVAVGMDMDNAGALIEMLKDA